MTERWYLQVDGDNLPPEEMNEEFRAYYHGNDGAYSQQKTVSVIDGHCCFSRSDFAELCNIKTPSLRTLQPEVNELIRRVVV